jgi:hypothetical protein
MIPADLHCERRLVRAIGVSQMLDEAILRATARAAVRAGKRPARRPDRTWGGPGVGAPFSVCEQPVRRDDLELEIQFARDGDFPGLDKFHVHVRCFAMWELERVNVQGDGVPVE